MDVGSADAAEHWAKNTMTLHVERSEMASLARAFEQAADTMFNWAQANGRRLSFPAMGADEVSQSIARRMRQSAEARPNGFLWALELAQAEYRATAAALRAGARDYTQTDDATAGDF